MKSRGTERDIKDFMSVVFFHNENIPGIKKKSPLVTDLKKEVPRDKWPKERTIFG